MKKKTTAMLLALFLGGVGIHKFYLGRIGWGIVYVLFCWTWIPLIASLIDFILLACMNEMEFNLKYNTKEETTPTVVIKPTTEVVVKEETSNYVDEVKKLYDLKEKGIITQEEFELKKKMLL